MAELDLSDKNKQFVVNQSDLEKLFKFLQSLPYGQVAQVLNEFAAAVKPLGESNESIESKEA
jgi:hypothetical protein